MIMTLGVRPFYKLQSINYNLFFVIPFLKTTFLPDFRIWTTLGDLGPTLDLCGRSSIPTRGVVSRPKGPGHGRDRLDPSRVE